MSEPHFINGVRAVPARNLEAEKAEREQPFEIAIDILKAGADENEGYARRERADKNSEQAEKHDRWAEQCRIAAEVLRAISPTFHRHARGPNV